jgi:hypothetical protein
MGILDEAIREHLELKRRSGAADSELKRMEDEAFGPPSRPGEPDFPESEEMAVHGGNGVATEAAVAEAPGTSEAPVAPPPEAPPEPAEPEEGEEEGEEEPPGEPDELAAAEHSVLEPPADPMQDEAEPAAPPEEAPESDQPTAIYDHSADQGQLEDLDLDLEERGPSSPEPGAQEGHSEATPDVSIESLETVEHPFPGEEEEERAEDAEEGNPDDVLADTPDFLKDAPEDDELWFEQGKPKDFDF